MSQFEELAVRVKECEKTAQEHLNLDYSAWKQCLASLESILVDRIDSTLSNKVSVAIENARVQTEEKLAANVEKTLKATTPPTMTWATIASKGVASNSTLSFSQSSGFSRTSQGGLTTLRITTPQVTSEESAVADGTGDEPFTRYMDAARATEKISNALKKHESTQNANVAGVGITKLGYVSRPRPRQGHPAAAIYKKAALPSHVTCEALCVTFCQAYVVFIV